MPFRFPAILTIVLLLLCPMPGEAQDLDPNRENSAVPVITFEVSWKQVDPQWYEVAIESTGRMSYSSQPRVQEKETPGDPFLLKFTATEATRTRAFELAKALNYFQGNFEHKGKVAQTGTKTLRYKDGEKVTETTFNYSSNPAILELTSMFQKISTTMEFGRRIAYHLRFDKLGVDAQLKRMEDLNKSGMLLEVQALEPLLKQIISDRSFMNLSRQRAQRLLGLPVSPSGSR